MPRPLQAHLDRLIQAHAAFLAAYDGLTPEAQTRPPAPGAWSPAEILEHLARAEDGTLRSIERQIAAGNERKDLGAPSRLKTEALMMVVAAPIRYRVPSRAVAIHPTDRGVGDWRNRFAGFDARWTAVAASLPAELTRVGLMRHPVIGALTAADAARFTALHVNRHGRQLARAIGAAA